MDKFILINCVKMEYQKSVQFELLIPIRLIDRIESTKTFFDAITSYSRVYFTNGFVVASTETAISIDAKLQDLTNDLRTTNTK